MPISFVHKHESGPNAGLADFRRRKLLHIVARVSVVFICPTALAGCSWSAPCHMISQTAYSKKFTESKSRTRVPLPSITRSRMTSQAAIAAKITESKSKTPIPLPAAPLLSPQPEPRCEFETTDTNTDERQKLDYERQCYRHAEMIVRARLELLQDSIDQTINAVRNSE